MRFSQIIIFQLIILLLRVWLRFTQSRGEAINDWPGDRQSAETSSCRFRGVEFDLHAVCFIIYVYYFDVQEYDMSLPFNRSRGCGSWLLDRKMEEIDYNIIMYTS